MSIYERTKGGIMKVLGSEVRMLKDYFSLKLV